MLALILGGADLAWVIALSGAIPLLSGVLSAVVARRSGVPVRFDAAGVTRERAMEIVPTAGWLLVVELSNLAMYAFSRVILGAYRSPAAVGQFEGPVRAHNLLYALGGALAVPVVPTASRYVAAGDARRLRGLAVRGTRYTLALFVPLVRDADGAGRADPRGVARRPLRGGRHRARDPRLVLAPVRRARRDARFPRRRRAGAGGGARLRRRCGC